MQSETAPNDSVRISFAHLYRPIDAENVLTLTAATTVRTDSYRG